MNPTADATPRVEDERHLMLSESARLAFDQRPVSLPLHVAEPV
ncbi:hypothetical protein OKW40_003571 [Paraburkholderia sp. RAU6.4a]